MKPLRCNQLFLIGLPNRTANTQQFPSLIPCGYKNETTRQVCALLLDGADNETRTLKEVDGCCCNYIILKH